jgi:hypothetical protein
VDCLRALLSAAAFNLLARAWGASFGPPATAGDVVGLYRQDQLRQIRGLGPRRHGEIQLGLQLAGLLDVGNPDPADRHQPAART